MNNSLSIFCDGGARGNPGPAASAFVVRDSTGKTLHKQGFYLGTATNNQAEYQAVIESLKWLLNNCKTDQLVNYYLDSLLVVNQLKGLYKIKNTNKETKLTIEYFLANTLRETLCTIFKIKYKDTPCNKIKLKTKIKEET